MAEQAPAKASEKAPAKSADEKKRDCSDDESSGYEKKEVELDLPGEIMDKIKKTGVTKKQLLAMNRLELRLFCLNECGMTMKEFQTVFALIKELIGGFTITNTVPWYIYFRKENTWLGYDIVADRESGKRDCWHYGKNIFAVEVDTRYQWGLVASGDQYKICRYTDRKRFIKAGDLGCELVDDGTETVFTRDEVWEENTDLIRLKFGLPDKWLRLANGSFGSTPTKHKVCKLRFSAYNVKKYRIYFRTAQMYLKCESQELKAAESVEIGSESMFEWLVVEEHHKRSVANKSGDNYFFIKLPGSYLFSFDEAPCGQTRLHFEETVKGCLLWKVGSSQNSYLRCLESGDVVVGVTMDQYCYFYLEEIV